MTFSRMFTVNPPTPISTYSPTVVTLVTVRRQLLTVRPYVLDVSVPQRRKRHKRRSSELRKHLVSRGQSERRVQLAINGALTVYMYLVILC